MTSNFETPCIQKTGTHLGYPVSERPGSALTAAILDLMSTLQQSKKLASSADVENIVMKIESVVQCFPGPLTAQKVLKLDCEPDFLREFCENGYGTVLESVIAKFDHSFPVISGNLIESVVRLFVVEDWQFFKESLRVLTQKLDKGTQKSSIVVLLAKVINSEGLFAILTHFLLTSTDKNDIKQSEEYSQYESVVQSIISLPNKVANALEGDIPNNFKPEVFSAFLILNLIKVVEFISDFLMLEKCKEDLLNFESLGLFFSKILINFHESYASKSLESFIKALQCFCSDEKKSATCKTVINGIFMNLQKPAVETLAIMLFQIVNPEKITSILSSHLLEKNKDWHFALTKKIPLLSYFEKNDVIFISNLVEYLNQASKKDLAELLSNLIRNWSDKFSLNHTTTEQHLYLTKLIIIITKHLKNTEILPNLQSIIQQKVFSGIPTHLESGTDKIRVIGMVVAEIMTEFLNDGLENKKDIKLEFEYEKLPKECQELAKNLKSLKNIQDFENSSTSLEDIVKDLTSTLEQENNSVYIPPDRQFRKRIETREPKNEIVLESCAVKKESLNLKIIDDENFELDSDDDLEAFDTSNDIETAKKQPPAYLRDLKDGLLETQDADVFILSIENCEKLILQQLKDDDASIGLELLQILISLNPQFFVENFDDLVFQSCVAITCTYPAVYAEYLSKEFHADNGHYSICHRVLILDVLSESAKVLSRLKPEKQTPRQPEKSKDAKISEDVIQKRLESKTRRFTKHKSAIFEKVNKFSEVAGYFFFPLIYGFGRSKFIPNTAPNDEDFVLLIHYLRTLSVIMCASQNCVIAPKMAREIFNLTWFLRFHKDAKVRMEVITMLAAAILNVPKAVLIQEFVDVLIEIRFWVMDIVSFNSKVEQNTDCKIMAAHLASVLEDVLKVDLDLDG